MIRNKEVTAFAKKQGYDGVMPLGKWNGYDCYEPYYKGTTELEPAFTGPPLIVLVKGDEIRMSTVEESYEQLNSAG